MRLSRIQVENFRNFHNLDIPVGQAAVIFGENQVGKSNLLHALRLVLDPSLPDSSRQLRVDDFWDGLPRPLSPDARIRISLDLTDFENDERHLAVLADHLVEPTPMVARLTYELRSLPGLTHPPTNESDFEFLAYGGGRPENRLGFDLRKRIPLEVMHALRDAEADLARWTRSPLRPLIDRAKASVPQADMKALADGVTAETDKIAALPPIDGLASRINHRLSSMAGSSQAISVALGLSPADPDRLLRALRLLFDGKKRDISEASLGTANVLYLALRSLELDALVSDGSREHTFFGIEEPEAHLHPHLQRLVYRSYLRQRQEPAGEDPEMAGSVTYLLTTHSPHIASVTPIESLVLLRRDQTSTATVGVAGAGISLSDADRNDLERYLDVSRAEALFARGIVLVEGEAERFLVPVLASCAGFDLDTLGITVCSVGGTDFAPYVKLFGPQGLGIPFAVVTDLDPHTAEDGTPIELGRQRAHALAALVRPAAGLPKEIQEVDYYEQFGIFLNSSTLELELNRSGCISMMSAVMQDLCQIKAANARFRAIDDRARQEGKVVDVPDPAGFIRDIEYVGKGRFAQRLAAMIAGLRPGPEVCPNYIRKAVESVAP